MTVDRTLSGSPRWLTLQRAQKARESRINTVQLMSANNEVAEIETRLEKLEIGQAKLYSFFGPPLVGGQHTITSTQSIQGGGQVLPDKSTSKTFTVQAPQYALADGAVHSCYPPPGAVVQAETLPHVLFPDPFLPWEREATDEGNDRERMPWLALIAFSEADLQLTPIQLNGNGSLFTATDLAKEQATLGKPIQLTPDSALDMPVADFSKVTGCVTPVPTSAHQNSRSNAIFVKKGLFDLLTKSYDEFGVASASTKVDLSRYQYLAHVRNSNAKGMEAVRDSDGLFSVIVSHRVGPLHDTTSSRTIVHLVSIEGWDGIDKKTWLDDKSITSVVLSSLYSWSYTTMAADALNVSESFRLLGKGVNLLGPAQDVLDEARKDESAQGQRILARLKDGYTLVKYHTSTGEETAGIVRGALAPTRQPDNLPDHWTSLSFSGSDLQIFDKDLGLMDLTYSTAWSLGKTLALADPVFAKSLSRLRSVAEAYALDEAKKKQLKARQAWKSTTDTVETLLDAVSALTKLAHGHHGSPQPSSVPGRLEVFSEAPVDLSRDNADLAASMTTAAEKKIRHLTGASDTDGAGIYKKFNELNTPNSVDWMVVLSWVIDKMYLFNIPAQYLVVEPSWLADESLRFFYIDPHWIDALIDGALSIANHISQNDDDLRRILKGAFNAYFKEIDPEIGYRPQIPTYGCFLRSHLVKDFPDLHVTAPFPEGFPDESPNPKHERAPILRHEKLAEDTLLLLFDRTPGKLELQKLLFTQPAHQQYFVVGDSISSKVLKTSFKRSYTKAPPTGKKYVYGEIGNGEYANPDIQTDETSSTTTPPKRQAFIWSTNQIDVHFLNVPCLVKEIWDSLQKDDVKAFDDDRITSALMGYQLGCPIYELGLQGDDPSDSSASPKPAALSALSVLNIDDNDNEIPRQFMMLNARPAGLTEAKNSAIEPIANVANAQPFALLESSETLTVEDMSPVHFQPMRASDHVIGSDDLKPAEAVARAAKRMLRDGAFDRPVPMRQESPGRVFNGKIFPPDEDPDDPSRTAVIDSDAGAPRFEWKIYPIGKYTQPIPTRSVEPQDLVFSIKMISGDSYDFGCTSIQLNVPMGPKDNPNRRKNLLAGYRGPGPVMLTNLRFNVIMSQSEKFLDLTLLPRSTTNVVPAKQLRDCSFLLPLVEINPYEEDVSVMVRHMEQYVQGPDQGLGDDIQVTLTPA